MSIIDKKICVWFVDIIVLIYDPFKKEVSTYYLCCHSNNICASDAFNDLSLGISTSWISAVEFSNMIVHVGVD